MNLLSRIFGASNTSGSSSPRPVDAATAHEWHKGGEYLLIDVREDSEHRRERIPGSHLAPLSRLEQAVAALPSDKKAVFLCQSGARTRAYATRLARCGFAEAYVLTGGMIAWKSRGLPVERG